MDDEVEELDFSHPRPGRDLWAHGSGEANSTDIRWMRAGEILNSLDRSGWVLPRDPALSRASCRRWYARKKQKQHAV
jgi:hypothetical protein